MKKVQIQAFTLVELLISMALIAIIFAIMSSVSMSMSQSSENINSRSLLMQDAQIANRILTGRLSEAIYVYPPDTVFTLTGTGVTAYNSIRPANGYTWTVNSDPFVAMILPPENPEYTAGVAAPTNCVAGSGSGTTATAAVTDGCYRFYAYYAVRRKDLVDAVDSTDPDMKLAPSSTPAPDKENRDAWVIMQYQRNLFGWTPAYTTPKEGTVANTLPPNNLITGGTGRVLLDYVQPQRKSNSNANDFYTGANGKSPGIAANCDMFCVKAPTGAGTGTATNNGKVEIRFRVEKDIPNKSPIVISGITPEGSDGERPFIGGVVSPRNWWQK